MYGQSSRFKDFNSWRNKAENHKTPIEPVCLNKPCFFSRSNNIEEERSKAYIFPSKEEEETRIIEGRNSNTRYRFQSAPRERATVTQADHI